MPGLPPIDVHAHIAPDIDERQLRDLRSAVFAVTRDPSEWALAAERRDELCVWGLGCHPLVEAAVSGFDGARLAGLIGALPLIGEIGLDGTSKVPMVDQRRVFRQALELARDHSRLASIHSVRASSAVLDELEAVTGVSGAILHWWRGDASQTDRAVELGCFFSLNGAEALRPEVIARLPRDRVLTETDYPHTRRVDKAASRPGAVTTIERALGETWDVAANAVRTQVWRNLATVCAATATSRLMPRALQSALLAAR